MKTKRKDISESKAEKLARKGLIKETLIVYGLIAIIFFILFLIFLSAINFNLSTFLEVFGVKHFLFVFVMPIILYLMSIVAFWFLRKPDYKRCAYKKIKEDYSKSLVEKNFIVEKPTNIILINTRDEAYKDFILGLPHVEKTYAILGKDNLISIYVKFIDKDAKHLDIITKEEFTTYCQIVDETSETERQMTGK